MFLNIFSIGMLFIAGVCILVGLGHLFLARAGKKKYFWSLGFFTSGLSLIYGFLFFANHLVDFPWFYGPHIPMIYLPAYFFYAYFRAWLNPNERIKHWLYLAPVVAVTIPVVFFMALNNSDEVRTAIESFYIHRRLSWREALYLVGYAYNLVFIVLCMHTLHHLTREISVAVRSIMTLFYLVAILCSVSILTMILGNILLNYTVLQIAGGGFFLAAFLGYLFMQRIAHTGAYIQAIENARYQQSRLAGIDLGEIGGRLTRLMQEERLYTDHELTMANVAAKLDLKPQQLSEYLNLHAKTSFKEFLKNYRLEEAKVLLSDPETTQMEQIGYRAGFGSKSSFNAIFRKATGMTPTQYHESQLAKRLDA